MIDTSYACMYMEYLRKDTNDLEAGGRGSFYLIPFRIILF